MRFKFRGSGRAMRALCFLIVLATASTILSSVASARWARFGDGSTDVTITQACTDGIEVKVWTRIGAQSTTVRLLDENLRVLVDIPVEVRTRVPGTPIEDDNFEGYATVNLSSAIGDVFYVDEVVIPDNDETRWDPDAIPVAPGTSGDPTILYDILPRDGMDPRFDFNFIGTEYINDCTLAPSSGPLDFDLLAWKDYVRVGHRGYGVIVVDDPSVDVSTLAIAANNGSPSPALWTWSGYGKTWVGFKSNHIGLNCDSTSIVVTATDTSGSTSLEGTHPVNPWGRGCW